MHVKSLVLTDVHNCYMF